MIAYLVGILVLVAQAIALCSIWKVPTPPDSDVALRASIEALGARGAWQQVVDAVAGQAIPNDAGVMHQLGFAYAKLGRLADAEYWYQRALRRDPGDISTRYLLARIYDQQADGDRAVSEYTRILNLNGSLPDVHLAYGLLLWRQGDREGAIREVGRARKLYPQNSPFKQLTVEELICKLAQPQQR